ncbi:MAG: 23S rRNA (guanosine(2251)-2'-O)-methyltransferase RlmB [Breznakia sp.]
MSEYIYGRNVARQRLKEGKNIISVNVMDAFRDKEIMMLAHNQKLVVQTKSKKALDEMVGCDKHQGIVLEVSAYAYVHMEELIQNNQSEYPLIVLLDGLEDPHNLGAVLRSGDALGINGVIIGKHRSVELNATVAKVSTGAIERVAVCRVVNLSQTLQQLKAKGYWVVGADMDTQAMCYDEPDYKIPLVLVIGSEGKGISKLVRKQCDFFVYLPMRGSVSSLNASVASAVLMYEIDRKRRR